MSGPPPVYVVIDEPRVRRRFWTSERRAKRAAKEALNGEGQRPNPFVVALRSGETYLIGHRTGIVTSLVSYLMRAVTS